MKKVQLSLYALSIESKMNSVYVVPKSPKRALKYASDTALMISTLATGLQYIQSLIVDEKYFTKSFCVAFYSICKAGPNTAEEIITCLRIYLVSVISKPLTFNFVCKHFSLNFWKDAITFRFCHSCLLKFVLRSNCEYSSFL